MLSSKLTILPDYFHSIPLTPDRHISRTMSTYLMPAIYDLVDLTIRENTLVFLS